MAESKEVAELQARLAATRAKRKAHDDANAESIALAELRRQAEKEEMDLADAEAMTAVECKLGQRGKTWEAVFTDFGVVIVQRAHSVAFRKFQDLEKFSMIEVEKMVRPCVVHPSPDAFDEICEKQPVVLRRCADAVTTLAGARRDELSAK